MTIKTTVGEWRAFMSCDWGHADAWFEDTVFTVDGQEITDDDGPVIRADAPGAFAPETALLVDGGVIMYPEHVDIEDKSLEPMFRRWRKAQTTAMVLVEFPREAVSEFTDAVKKFKGRIVK